MKTYLLLENGQVFEGEQFGSAKDTICKLVFNTAMVGYTDIITNPSYSGLGVVMTYPLIGNYGICSADVDGIIPHVGSFIVREVCDSPSNFRCDQTFDEYLKKSDITGIKGVDTRAITKIIRNQGSMNAMITTEITEQKKQAVKDYVLPKDIMNITYSDELKNNSKDKTVAVLNLGSERSVLNELSRHFGTVKVFKADVTAQELLSINPNGIFITSGAGNPKNHPEIIGQIKELVKSDVPIFAIGLGHLMLALAMGLDTKELNYAQTGGNFPIRSKKTGVCHISTQSRLYTVTDDIDKNIADISFININDGTVEGLDYTGKNIISIAFTPLADDTISMFNEFEGMTGGVR